MTIKELATGKTLSVSACYGARLIEQGKAVSIKEEKAAVRKNKPDKGKEPQGATSGDV